MKKKLVIVESPAKAKTLSKILGKGYNLKASLGHIRDLPKSKLGVDIEDNFTPQYVIPRVKSKVVTEMKHAVKDASEIYLATDPDREGEAIAWHLAEVAKKANGAPTYHRVVFHEITSEAIKEAFKHPRDIDINLVNAQQARRVLDRLVGYQISPLLWRKVKRGLSAGRVQSVTVKIIVDREKEIEAFVPQEYWTLDTLLTTSTTAKKPPVFQASLAGLANGEKLTIDSEDKAKEIEGHLKTAAYTVGKVVTQKSNRQPSPPFITSTLQQEAWRKLRFSAKQTMAIAQQLYEGLPIENEGEVGLITYMRTDSTHIAESALAETRDYIQKTWGNEYLPQKPRVFRQKVRGAQEAHEAIRPTGIQREPTMIKKHLNSQQFKLYELIWKRMVASQMMAAGYENTSVEITAQNSNKGESYLLKSSHSKLIFPGFTVLYSEGKDEEDEEKKSKALPPLSEGKELSLVDILTEQHFTQPHNRFTEATLVKMLEQKGIGRPSTYAPILSTIQDREYVVKERGSFRPTELGVIVNELLVKNFSDIVNIRFTARMEDELDEIAQNERAWTEVVSSLYTPLAKDLEKAHEKIEKVKLPDEVTDELCPKCGKNLLVKTGRFGKFLACSGYPECKFTKPYQVKVGVKCPECGSDIVERISKKKRIFYGCSKYPECTFATFNRPLPTPCPKCGGLLTMAGKDKVKCTKCDYKGKPEEES